MKTVNLSIAGADFQLRLFRGVPSHLRHGYPLFETEKTLESPAVFDVVPQDAFDAPPHVGPLVWDSFRWQMGNTEDGRYVFNLKPPHLEVYETIATTTQDFSQARFTTSSVADYVVEKCPLRWPVDEQIFLNRLAHLGCGLIHSSAVEYDGKMYMFCGKSGAGKSTTGEIWKRNGHTLLNDDRIVVRMDDGIAKGASTPWHGSVPEIIPAMLPLGGIFHLTQATENRLRPMDYFEGLTQLMANAIAPFYLESSMNRLIEAYAAVMEQVPAYELFFTPDDRAMECVLAEIGA